MKKIIIFIFYFPSFFQISIAQNLECYQNLLRKGIAQYDSRNYSEAILKWESALNNCPNLTPSQKNTLTTWITKAKTSTTTKKIITQKSIIRKTLPQKTSSKKQTRKRNNDTNEEWIEAKPLIDYSYPKREPYHPYGEGYGRLFLYTNCGTGGKTNVWIDENFIGTWTKYYIDTIEECPYWQEDEAATDIKLTIGQHHIKTKDALGAYTDFYVQIEEDVCLKKIISCDTKKDTIIVLPEVHPYGQFNGQIFVYSTCSTGGYTNVWIDGNFEGAFNIYYSNPLQFCLPITTSNDGVRKILSQGQHHIQTKNQSGATTDFYFVVTQDICSPIQISCAR